MKGIRPWALVSAGPLKSDSILRLPVVKQRLGPVLGVSYQLGCRLVNRLRAGHAARAFAEVAVCDRLLISLPPSRLDTVLDELLGVREDWRGAVVLLYDCPGDSRSLRPLTARGAATGWLAPVTEIEKHCCIAEGDRLAMREALRLLHGSHVPLLEIATGGQPLWTAAQMLCGQQLIPRLEGVSECLRASGLNRHHVVPVVERLIRQTLVAYRRMGRSAMRRTPLSDWRLEAIRRALPSASPQLRRLLESVCAEIGGAGEQPSEAESTAPRARVTAAGT